ncbi:MAG: DUF6042 family protein [Bacillota bacterium]
MFSFQKTINYITNGKVTVRTLVGSGLIPIGQCVIPNQFYEMGWGKWLPMPSIISLPYLSHYIACGLKKDEIIKFLKQRTKPNMFIDYSIKQPLNASEIEKEEFELLYVREVEVKHRLEVNGYEYPRNIMDVVNLYVALGLVIELQDDDSQEILDLIVRPLAPVDTILPVQTLYKHL